MEMSLPSPQNGAADRVSIRRVEKGDLTALKNLHDACFPICYPEEFYPKLLQRHWVALVAVLPLDDGYMPTPGGCGIQGSLGFGIVGKRIDTSTNAPSKTEKDVAGPSSRRLDTRTRKDRIIGFITGTGKLLCSSVIPTHVGYISTFGVDPCERRGGVGTLMFNAFMRIMRYEYDFKDLRVLALLGEAGASTTRDEQLPYYQASTTPRSGDKSDQTTSLMHRLADLISEYFFQTSPSALIAMGVIRLTARCEDVWWRWRGKQQGRERPSHDQRIFGDPLHRTEVTQVWLHVLASNTNAIDFYLKKNFKKVKHLAKFYNFNDADHDGIIMCYDLAAEIQLGKLATWDHSSGGSVANGGAEDCRSGRYFCSVFSVSELAGSYSSPINLRDEQPHGPEEMPIISRLSHGERGSPHSLVTRRSLSTDTYSTVYSNMAARVAFAGSTAVDVSLVGGEGVLVYDERGTLIDRSAAGVGGGGGGPSATVQTEHGILLANSRSTLANWLFQLFTSAPLTATFESLDNIEESEQSNAIQWLVCTTCLVLTAVVGLGGYALVVLSQASGSQGGGSRRRSVGSR